MNKISNAIYEINKLDELANQKQWINQIHPLIKLLVTVGYIIIIISFDQYDLSKVLVMGVYPITIFILGEISFMESLWRLRIVLPLVCVIGIFNPFYDKTVAFQIGEIEVTTGMISMATLMIKGIYSVLASYLLIVTTTIEKICYALRLLHVPVILITQILLTYRYISVLLSEVNRITQAYSLRAPNQKGIHVKVWGSLMGQLLLRSIDRAGIIYDSMNLRGYDGRFYYYGRKVCNAKNWIYLFFWVSIFLVLKFGMSYLD